MELRDIASDERALAAFISGLTISNKNKSIISFLSLMNMHKQLPLKVQFLIDKEEAFIPLIELMIICLKDQADTDFIDLYNSAL